MMLVVGIKDIAVKKLYLPGDFGERLRSERVAKLAQSIDQFDGALNEPIVRESDWQLVCGFDRVAAHVYLKRDMCRMKIIQCDDAELEKIRVDENYHRRHYTPEERQAIEDQALSFNPTPMIYYKKPGKKGPPIKATTMARKEAAEQLGMSPESLRKKDYRRRKSLNRAKAPIRDLGMAVDADYRIKVAEAQELLEMSAESIVKARGAIAKLMKSDLPLQKPRLMVLMEQADELAEAAKGAIPSCLCPGCKGLGGVQEKCQFCLTAGYITKNQQDGIPDRLWDSNWVQLDGELRPVNDFVKEEEPW